MWLCMCGCLCDILPLKRLICSGTVLVQHTYFGIPVLPRMCLPYIQPPLERLFTSTSKPPCLSLLCMCVRSTSMCLFFHFCVVLELCFQVSLLSKTEFELLFVASVSHKGMLLNSSVY